MKCINAVYVHGSEGAIRFWEGPSCCEWGWEHDPTDPSGYAVYRGTREQMDEQMVEAEKRLDRDRRR